jgi:hypothetical protein
MAAPAFAASLAAPRPTCGARARPAVSRRRAAAPAPTARRAPRAALPPPDQVVDAHHAASAVFADALSSLHLATKGDIGPLTNVDIEATGLALAVTGGTLLASFIVFVLVRF